MNSQIDKSNNIAFVIFGVTGDLARRKLLPAIYQLYLEKRINEKLDVIGFARRPWGDAGMRQILSQGIEEFSRNQPVDSQIIGKILGDATYMQYEFEDDEGYINLYQYLNQNNYRRIIFYLATPPNSYGEIIRKLNVCKSYSQEKDWLRIVVEKPYGRDIDSATQLERALHSCFSEDQIYRIDHYLGKETVQNILVFRFANGIFEPLWNNKYIDHIQITVAETVGVGERGGYFDDAGVIRDMFANHMLQLLSLTAMEAPYAFNAGSVRDEKMKVLKSLRPMKGGKAIENTIRGQYRSTRIGNETYKGYLEEIKVKPDSRTETYLAARIHVDNWRWANVPFYLRSGKRMPVRATEIAIQFKQIPLSLFNWKNMAGEAPNVLVLRLQPDEGINLSFGAKLPGPINQIAPVTMQFCYQDAFGSQPPEAYERLLLDCIQGDQTLFTRTDEVIEQWRFVSDILEAWSIHQEVKPFGYDVGSWGPLEADEFLRKDNRIWRFPQ